MEPNRMTTEGIIQKVFAKFDHPGQQEIEQELIAEIKKHHLEHGCSDVDKTDRHKDCYLECTLSDLIGDA